jgi:GNAT superfamily N-acetyltransferase
VKLDNIAKNIAAGNCWLIDDPAGTVIGTVTVDDYADPKLWKPEDEPDRALYVHRLVLEDTARGSELGSAVLDWAGEQAETAGRKWLRLDAWSSNPGLHRYYLNHGFRHVRTVTAPDIPSGVRFERDATIRLGRGPQLQQR